MLFDCKKAIFQELGVSITCAAKNSLSFPQSKSTETEK